MKTTHILAGSILALLATHSAQADSAIWSGLTDALWATTSNWTSDPQPVPGSQPGETATFNNDGNGNLVIDLGTGVSIRSILFDSGSAAAYTIGSGGPNSQSLALESSGSLTVNASVFTDQLIDASLTLGTTNGAQSFTATNNAVTNLLTLAGDLNSGTSTGSKTLTFNGSGSTVVTGVISNGSGSLSLIKSGSGSLTLDNNTFITNSYSGSTTVSAGTLNAFGTDTLGDASTLLVNGGTLALGGFTSHVGTVTLTSGNITSSTGFLFGTSFALESGSISAKIGGSAATVTKTSSGTVTLSGNNTFTGQLSVQNGALSIATMNSDSSAGTLGNSSLAVVLGNSGNQTGTIRYTGASTTSSKKFTLATDGTGNFQVDTAATTLELSGLISGDGILSKTGDGILKISSANTYTGGTTISAGSVILANQTGFGTGTVTFAGGTSFKTNNFEGNGSGGALPNAFILTSGKVTTDVGFGGPKDIWINTSVSGAGGFTLIGSGRDQGLTLSGPKTFTGGVTLGTVASQDGVNVSIDNPTSLGTGTLRSELMGSDLTKGGLRINADLSAGVANNLVIASGARIVINHVANQPATLSGIISDEGTGGSLYKVGGSTLTLSGANTFKGTTTISTGTLTLANPLALQNSTLSYSAGTLTFGTLTAATLGGITGSQSLALTNDSTQSVALTLGGNSTTYASTFTDGAAAGGSLTKSGAGTLTLTNNSALSQTGPTTINAGSLLLTGSAPTSSSAVTVNSGGTFGGTTNLLTLNSSLTFNGLSGFQIQTGTAATGNALVNGDLAVNGSPTLRLAPTSPYSTPVAGDKVLLTYTGTLTNNAAWTVDSSLLNAGGVQTSNWTAGNGTWITPANWDQQGWSGSVAYDNPNKQLLLTGFAIGNIAPIPTTNAVIAPANIAAVTGPATASSVASLSIGNSTFAHSLTLQAAAPLTVTGAVSVNPFGSLNASAAALTSNSLSINGGSVILGAGSSTSTLNLTSGSLAATAGTNELTVSNKLVSGNTTITAGSSPFKVGGTNLVSSIDKLVVQGGTTKIVNATYGSISVADTGTVWSSSGGVAFSNPYTVSSLGNVLVVHVSWRASNINASTLPPVISYDGVPLIQAANAYDAGAGNWANAAVYYLYNPTTSTNLPLAVSFPQGGITDYNVDAFTLSGANTNYNPVTSGSTAGVLPLDTRSATSLTLNNIPTHGVASSAVVYRTTNGIPTSLVGSVTSGDYGSLEISGPGGGTGLQWKANAPSGATIVGAGVLVNDITSSSLTTTVTADKNTARFGMASVAFAPTSTLFAINRSSMALSVTGASTLDLGSAPSATLGSLTTETASSLTLTNAPAAGVSFSNIVANGTSQINTGAPIIIRNSTSSVSVASGKTLTIANNIVRTGGSDTLEKSGTGTVNFTGNLYSVTDSSSTFRRLVVKEGVLKLTNSNAYLTRYIVGANGIDANVVATNSNIISDGNVDNGDLNIANNSKTSYDMHGGSLTTIYGGIYIGLNGGGGNMTIDSGATVSLNTDGNSGNYSEWRMGDGGSNSSAGKNNFVTMRGATTSVSIPTNGGLMLGVASGSINVFNQLDGTVNLPKNTGTTPFNGTPAGGLNLQYRMNREQLYGIYNLNGGTATIGAIMNGDGATGVDSNNAYFNFHGGTLKPSTNDTNYVRTSITGANAARGATRLTVYSEGAVIDTAGFNIGIQTPISAPGGNGAYADGSRSLTVAALSEGSGYQATPEIVLTAVAQTVSSGTATSGNNTITGLSSTANLLPGARIYGSNIPTGARVATVDSVLNTVTLDLPASGSGSTGTTTILGQAATAVANMADDGTGNGTLKIVSITITNPGVGFGSAAPLVTITHGSPTLAATLPTLTTASNLSGGLTKNGAGALTLAAANTYAGATNLNAGSIIATNASALGTTAAGTTIASAATLDVRANIGAESLTLGGSGLSGNGTLITGAIASTGTVGGPITLNAHTILGGVGSLNLNGAISGGFNLTKIGAGTTSFGAAGSLIGVANLTADLGTTNVNSTLGNGSSAVSVGLSTPANLKFGSVSQSLASLTIGAGSTVTFSSDLASGAFTSTDSKATNFTASVVPEPSSVALLLVGALGMLNRRRRSA